jgi:putative tricarboxylic transport membrane protein
MFDLRSIHHATIEHEIGEGSMFRRRRGLCAAAFIVSLWPALACAQAKYPQSTVTIVTHSSPGGGSDVFIRELARVLGPAMGVTFVVENIRGGSGARAVAKVAQAPADGSIFYATTPTYIQTTLLSKTEFGYTGLDPLAVVFYDPEVLFTRSQSPFKNLGDALASAKAGRGKWGAANPGSLERMALERLNRATGAKAAIVSHEGGGDLMINVLNGTLDMGVGEVEELQSQIAAGQVRLLAVLTDKRLAKFPDLPTAREQNVDVVVTKFRGLAGPKGMPDDIAKLWEAGLAKALANPTYRKIYESDSLIPTLMGREAARDFTTKFADDIRTSFRDMGLIR